MLGRRLKCRSRCSGLHAVKAPGAIDARRWISDRRCPSSALDLSCTPHKPCVTRASELVPCANFGQCAGTAIPPWKRRIPFDLRSKARSGPVSTEVGDDSGILRCRSFLLDASLRFASLLRGTALTASAFCWRRLWPSDSQEWATSRSHATRRKPVGARTRQVRGIERVDEAMHRPGAQKVFSASRAATAPAPHERQISAGSRRSRSQRRPGEWWRGRGLRGRVSGSEGDGRDAQAADCDDAQVLMKYCSVTWPFCAGQLSRARPRTDRLLLDGEVVPALAEREAVVSLGRHRGPLLLLRSVSEPAADADARGCCCPTLAARPW